MRTDGLAQHDQFKRVIQPRHPGQALGACRTGENPQIDLGRAHPRARARDPEMAPQCQFQPATERRTMDRRNNRFFDGIEMVHHANQMWLAGRLVEFPDIGARRECPPHPDDHDGIDSVIGSRAIKLAHQPLAHADSQRVDRWVVDGQNCHTAFGFIADEITHFHPLMRAPVRGFPPPALLWRT